MFPKFFQSQVYAGGVLETIMAVVKTNAHPYGAQLVALLLSVAPVLLVFVFIIVAALTWRYRTRKRHGPIPPQAEFGHLDLSELDVPKKEERRP